jgi:hypothetical protein
MSRPLNKGLFLTGLILILCLAGLIRETGAQPWGQETQSALRSSPAQTEKTDPSSDQTEKIKTSPESKDPAQTQESVPEEAEIHAGPKDIKEEIGIYVFLGWLWLSIFVMIYLLREKIKETDRLHSFRYFAVSENKPSDQDPA